MVFYRSGTAAPSATTDNLYPDLISIGTVRAELSVAGESAGAATITAVVDNSRSQLASLFAVPPHQTVARARYTDNKGVDRTYFTGRIDSIAMGDQISVGIVAPLVQPLPLRRTTAWGRYGSDEALPIGWGTVTLQPRRYDSRGRLWHLVDGEAAELITVTRRGELYGNAQLINERDEAGAPVALMEVGDPSTDAGDWGVTVRINSRTNPADVILDLLTLAGESVSDTELAAFRLECAGNGIELHGLAGGEYESVRGQIGEIMESVGGAWAQTAAGIARLWPAIIRGDEPVVREFSNPMSSGSARSDEADIITELTVRYDYNWAAGNYRLALVLRATDAYERYGYRPAEINARWVVSDRQAVRLGQRWLQYYSRPLWRATINGPGGAPISPGALVNITVSELPVSGEMIALSVIDDLVNGAVTVETEAPAGQAGSVSLVSQAALDGGEQTPLLIDADADQAVITALDANGDAAPGAVVTIANKSVTADANGRAVFDLSPGFYDVSIRYPDGTLRTLINQQIGA